MVLGTPSSYFMQNAEITNDSNRV